MPDNPAMNSARTFCLRNVLQRASRSSRRGWACPAPAERLRPARVGTASHPPTRHVRSRLLRAPLLVLLMLPVVSLSAQVPAPADQKASEIYDAGMRLLREKHYAEALEQFQQEEKLAPTLPQGAVGEGIALALLGRLPESSAALNRALQIDPTDWMARRELGIVEWQLNQKDQAAKDLEQIVKLFPTDP